MKMIEIPIKDLNQIIICMIVFFIAMAIALICNFNFTRNKIKNIQFKRF